ncbi:MAG: hypothetical protein OSB18_12205, partial [SAR324 cluster bacterium]|nr:hypothetical protein [SAR324 cluster bacterium]
EKNKFFKEFQYITLCVTSVSITEHSPPKMPPVEVAQAIIEALRSETEEVYPGDMASGVSQGLAADPKAIEKDFAQYLPQ